MHLKPTDRSLKTNINIALGFLLTILSFSNLYGQNDSSKDGEIHEREIFLYSKGPIQYKFPHLVALAVDSCIRIHPDCFILISGYDSLAKVLVNAWPEVKHKSSEGKRESRLLRKSNRFYEFNGHKIPIILDTDYQFAGVGFLYTGYLLEITFICPYMSGKEKIISVKRYHLVPDHKNNK